MSYSGEMIYCAHDSEGEVRVLDDGERRTLSFGPGDEQSACLKKRPSLLLFNYTQAMMLALLFNSPKKVLCLGLGAGSLINALHAGVKGCKFTAVEKRKQVIHAAQNYFYLPIGKRLEIVCDSAEQHLKQTQKKYDLIFSDLYTLDGADPAQYHPDYFKNISRNLKSQGIFILNVWTEEKKGVLEEELQKVFPGLLHCNAGEGNHIYLARQSRFDLNRKELKAKETEWSRKLGFSLQRYLNQLNSITISGH